MCIGGRLGMTLEVEDAASIFAETNGCLLVEVAEDKAREFEACFAEIEGGVRLLGHVTEPPVLEIRVQDAPPVWVAVGALVDAFTGNN
jgi:hypothetical protein